MPSAWWKTSVLPARLVDEGDGRGPCAGSSWPRSARAGSSGSKQALAPKMWGRGAGTPRCPCPGRRWLDASCPRARRAEQDLVDLAAALDPNLEALGQRVGHGRTDAVEAAGVAVALAVELAAHAELGEHADDRGDLELGVDVDRDPAAVVGDRQALAIGVEHDLILDAWPLMTSSTALSRISQTMWCRPSLSIAADVHGRARAHVVDVLQELDRVGDVALGRLLGLGLGHGGAPSGSRGRAGAAAPASKSGVAGIG